MELCKYFLNSGVFLIIEEDIKSKIEIDQKMGIEF